MEEKKLPWLKPWKGVSHNDYNYFSSTPEKRIEYHGYNNLLCELTRLMELNSEDTRWGTMRQIQQYNKQFANIDDMIYIKEGSHGLPIKYFKTIYYDANGNEIPLKDYKEPSSYHKKRVVKKTYTIFNACQMVKYIHNERGEIVRNQLGIPLSVPALEKEENDLTNNNFKESIEAEKLIKATGAVIEEKEGDNCFYSPKEDKITIVKRGQFNSRESFYDTLLHELIHWTGHEKRLNREEARNYTDANNEFMAKEEMIAEIGGYLLAKECNIATEPSRNNCAYVQSWMKEFKDNPRYLREACKKAEEAKKFIIDKVHTYEKENGKKKEMDTGYSM